MNFQFNGTRLSSWETAVPVNFSDFRSPIPAQPYMAATYRFWSTFTFRGPNQGIRTIYEDRYFPTIIVPSVFQRLDPAWSDCKATKGINDPPGVITATSELPVISLKPFTTSTTLTTAVPEAFLTAPLASSTNIAAQPVHDASKSTSVLPKTDSEVYNGLQRTEVTFITFQISASRSENFPTIPIEAFGPGTATNGQGVIVLAVSGGKVLEGGIEIRTTDIRRLPTDHILAGAGDSLTKGRENTAPSSPDGRDNVTLMLGGPAVTTLGHTFSIGESGLMSDGTIVNLDAPNTLTVLTRSEDSVKSISSSGKPKKSSANSERVLSKTTNSLLAFAVMVTIAFSSNHY
jgi:hypothetical protein